VYQVTNLATFAATINIENSVWSGNAFAMIR